MVYIYTYIKGEGGGEGGQGEGGQGEGIFVYIYIRYLQAFRMFETSHRTTCRIYMCDTSICYWLAAIIRLLTNVCLFG